jgi:hypothetical protein
VNFIPNQQLENDTFYTVITTFKDQHMNFRTEFRISVKIYLENPFSYVSLILFRSKQLLFIKISEIRICEKKTHFHSFHRVLSHKRNFWRRIRNQRENLPRNPFSIRFFIVVLRWHRFCRVLADLEIWGSRFSDN